MEHEPPPQLLATYHCRDLLSASVARLGSDIAKVCPQFQLREEDEEAKQKLFCMVYARYQDLGLRRIRVLNPEMQVLRFFLAPGAEHEACLMLHTKEQDHHIMELVDIQHTASSSLANSPLSNSLASSPVGPPQEVLLPVASSSKVDGDSGACSLSM